MSSKELMISAFLSYLNFSKEDIGKKVIDILQDDKRKKLMRRDFIDILSYRRRSYTIDFFFKEFSNLEIVYIENKTHLARDNASLITGYYAICFKNAEGKYLLSFRGSETTTFEDAYMDFIKTDLMYGVGKIPLQFYQGVNTYKKLIDKYDIPMEEIVLLGHSLGGGIAQYVAVISSVEMDYIPETYTFNGVGIDREGILNIKDFLKFEKIFKDVPKDKKDNFKYFFNTYSIFLQKEIKKYEQSNEYIFEDIDIDLWFKRNFFLKTNVMNFIKNFDLAKNNDIRNDKNILPLFKKDNIKSYMDYYLEASKKIKQKNIFNEKIINYGNTKDLTNSLFNHFGQLIYLDKNLACAIQKERTFKDSMKIFDKFISKNHKEIAFIPFFDAEGEFTSKISIDYIASVLRKILYNYIQDNDMIADFLENKLPEKSLKKYKNNFIKILRLDSYDIVYGDLIANELEHYTDDDFINLWQKIHTRIAAPYRFTDIYDVVVWKEKQQVL